MLRKLGTSHDVKGFAIGSFLERIVVERAKDDPVMKMLKMLVWSAKTDRYLTKCSLKNNHKIGRFYWLIFGEVCPNHSRESAAKSADVSAILSLKIPRNLPFFHLTYQKPSIVWRDPSDLKISWSQYKFGGKLALFMWFIWHIFHDERKARSDEMFGLILLCRTRIFSRQGKNVSRIGDRISRNFEPWSILKRNAHFEIPL